MTRPYIDEYYAVTMEIAAERERHGIEVTCHERFFRTLNRIELPAQSNWPELAEMMRGTHMKAVREVTSTPAANAAAVRRHGATLSDGAAVQLRRLANRTRNRP